MDKYLWMSIAVQTSLIVWLGIHNGLKIDELEKKLFERIEMKKGKIVKQIEVKEYRLTNGLKYPNWLGREILDATLKAHYAVKCSNCEYVDSWVFMYDNPIIKYKCSVCKNEIIAAVFFYKEENGQKILSGDYSHSDQILVKELLERMKSGH